MVLPRPRSNCGFGRFREVDLGGEIAVVPEAASGFGLANAHSCGRRRMTVAMADECYRLKV